VGRDTRSFLTALKASLREDPDVILVGELRDLETIQLALTAAETGHLVFATLHTNSAASTITRIVDVFPPSQQEQVRSQLASVLRGVITQRLFKRIDGTGRVGAFEIMICNTAVKNLIRENKVFQIPNVMQTARAEGMVQMEASIRTLVSEGKIPADALSSL
jgi:twitching motility protein PilT